MNPSPVLSRKPHQGTCECPELDRGTTGAPPRNVRQEFYYLSANEPVAARRATPWRCGLPPAAEIGATTGCEVTGHCRFNNIDTGVGAWLAFDNWLHGVPGRRVSLGRRAALSRMSKIVPQARDGTSSPRRLRIHTRLPELKPRSKAQAASGSAIVLDVARGDLAT